MRASLEKPAITGPLPAIYFNGARVVEQRRLVDTR
jgi:hypothetical protein